MVPTVTPNYYYYPSVMNLLFPCDKAERSQEGSVRDGGLRAGAHSAVEP